MKKVIKIIFIILVMFSLSCGREYINKVKSVPIGMLIDFDTEYYKPFSDYRTNTLNEIYKTIFKNPIWFSTVGSDIDGKFRIVFIFGRIHPKLNPDNNIRTGFHSYTIDNNYISFYKLDHGDMISAISPNYNIYNSIFEAYLTVLVANGVKLRLNLTDTTNKENISVNNKEDSAIIETNKNSAVLDSNINILYLNGNIDKYPITMEIDMDNGTGWYYYNKVKTKIKLSGKLEDDNRLTLIESVDGEITGTFYGNISDSTYKGIWKNSDNSKQFDFYLE